MKILVRISVGAFVAIETAACRPSDVLSVPAPASVVATGSLNNRTGAEGAFNSAKAQLFSATYGYFRNGLLMWDGLLTDEFTLSALTFYGFDANIDARMTTIRGTFAEDGDYPWERLLQARSDLLLALPGLAQYEPTSARSSVGEAHALAGYAELLVAESYCAGTPLDAALPGGTIRYTMPLTTDSLLGVAEAHFDSAIGTANGDAGVAALASVGLGRVLVDRGRYAAAAAAVASVLTNFVYNAELEPSFNNGATQSPSVYAVGVQSNFYRLVNVADQEGTNGLNFVSAHDPRLRLDSTLGPTEDGASAWYLPTKFEANLSTVPLATGIEARLIEAEAALKANDPATWLADLNTLRNSGCTVPGGRQHLCARDGAGAESDHGVGLPQRPWHGQRPRESNVPRAGVLVVWHGAPPGRSATVDPTIRAGSEHGVPERPLRERDQSPSTRSDSELRNGRGPHTSDTSWVIVE